MASVCGELAGHRVGGRESNITQIHWSGVHVQEETSWITLCIVYIEVGSLT